MEGDAEAAAATVSERAVDAATPSVQQVAPAPAPMRALAERTSRPLDNPAPATGEATTSAPGVADAKAAPTVAAPAPDATAPSSRAAASPESAPKPADSTPAPDPSIDQAPSGGGEAPSAEAASVTRDTSLSSLSRATIEATAQIAAQILRKLEGRTTRFEMALTPDDLGRVDVQLDIDSEGRLAARLAFDNPAAATDLRGRADALRRELEDAGFHMAEDAFEFTQRDSGSSGFDRGQDARHGSNRAFAAASRLNAEIDVAQPPRWMALSLSPSGVDLKV